MAAPIEQDVILDADGKSIYSAMEYIQREIVRIQRAVRDIGKDSYKSADDFGKALAARTKELQTALAQMRTLNAPGTAAGDYEAALKEVRERTKAHFRQEEAARKESLARQRQMEREAARGFADIDAQAEARRTESRRLATAARIEAARAEIAANTRIINNENELAAARRKNDEDLRRYRAAARTETDPAQQRALATLIALERDRGRALESQEKALGRLTTARDRDYAASQRAATAASKASLTAARQSERMFSAASGPTPAQIRAQTDAMWASYDRTNKAPSVSLTSEQQAGAAAVAAMNRRQLDADLAADRQRIASARIVRQSRLDAAKANVVDQTKAINNENELALARSRNVEMLQRLRAAQRTETDPEQLKAIATLIQIERERARAIEQVTRAMNQQKAAVDARFSGIIDMKTVRALIPGDVRDTAMREGTSTARLGYQFEQENARQRLLAATNEAERVAALKNLDLANARVAAVDRLAREEQRVLDLEMRQSQLDMTGRQRAQVALAGQYAREQIANSGLSAAMEAQKERVLLAETNLRSKLVGYTMEERTLAQQTLELEKARLRAMEQQANQQARTDRSSLLGRAGTAIKNTALYGVVAGLGYGAFNMVQQTVSDVIRLEDEFAKLQAISDSTDMQMQSLKGSIHAIGEGSRYTTNDLVKMAQTLAQAGVSAAQMEDVLRSVTVLATASGSTPDEAVQLVTAALGSFQLQASEAGRVADLMTSALNRTKLTVGQVAQAIQYVGATAYEQNISLENLLATVGAVAQGGVRSGSTIGTGFRQFLVDLQTPSEKLNFELERLGITQDDINIKTRGLAAVLETLKEKGFNATSAYRSLEVRAAAFYLVAKNNTDIMSDLQLSFAQSGAAAIANERAMNSLTAQWQRFKNILESGFAESMETPMAILQNLLKALSDRILHMRELAEGLRQRQAEGTAAWYERDLGKGAENTLREALNSFGQLSTLGQYENVTGNKLGDWIDSWTRSAEKGKQTAEVYADAIKNATDQVDEHGSTIVEVDKEMARLRAQQGYLINHTKEAQAETVNLTSRFEGLVKYLGTTKNAYLDLIQAMGQYRGEESRLLSQAYSGQVAAQQRQNNLDRGSLGSTINQIRNNPQLLGMLTATERQSLNTPMDVNFPARMAAAADRIAKTNADLANVLNEAAEVASRLAIGTRAAARGRDLAGQARAAGTPLGQQSESIQTDFQSRLDAINTQDQASRVRNGNALMSDINRRIGQYQARLPNTSGDLNKYIKGMIDSLTGMLDQVKAAIKPTQEEIKEAKRQKAENDRAEREAARRPKITQGDIDKVGQALGLALGSGTRTPAEQEALFRRGVTPARGFGPRASNHVTGVARDFSVRGLSDEEAERKATVLRAQYRQMGIEAQVKYERGGRNDGTGRHIHVGVRPGARFSKDRSEESEDQYDASLDQSQVELEQQNLRTQLKEVARATTEDAFQTAVGNARAALEHVNQAIRESALSEMASRGVDENSVQGRARMAQVAQQVEQNIADFNQKVSDAIIKSIDKQLKAADRALTRATQASRDAASFADARVSGLSYQSNANRVPDYVTAGAQRAAAMAKENVDRSTLANLPARIAAQRYQIQRTENDPLLDTDIKRQKVEELTEALNQLEQQRASLSAALSAGGLVPTTIGEGLSRASAEYQQAHDLTKSFKDTVIMNLGGAIENVHNGLTTMFSDIFTGSKSALGAFGDFAVGVGKYMAQLAAQFVASQALKGLFSLLGLAVPGIASSTGVTTGSSVQGPVWNSAVAFNGGLIGYPNSPYAAQHYINGGKVMNGDDQRDSVHAKLAKGEWVVNKRAVDSVGNQFMANLNAQGAAAVAAQSTMPPMKIAPNQQMAVYVVAPDQQPSMSPNDVLVTFANDILSGGETKKLIRYVQQGG